MTCRRRAVAAADIEDHGADAAPAAEVGRQIVIYSWVMVGVSLLLTPLGYTGWFYTAVALATGGYWLWEAHGLLRRAKEGLNGSKLKEMRLFHWSITYVSLLFVAVAVDPFLR